jgi:hypothetical protein
MTRSAVRSRLAPPRFAFGYCGAATSLPKMRSVPDVALGRGRAGLFRGFRHHREWHSRQPAIDKVPEPGALGHVVHRATFEVEMARPGARQCEPRMTARGPAMHHRVGHIGMKLEAECVVELEGLDREVASLCQQFGAVGQLKALAVPMVDMVGPTRADLEARCGGADRVIPDLGLPWGCGATRAPSCIASICAPRQIPRNGRCSRSGTAIQSISRRTKSSGSLALIGPPKMTAPAWPSSVFGSGSPNRGRLMSRGCPSARNALPTRPGVEVSWCRMIRTGSPGAPAGGAGRRARTPPGRCSTVSASILTEWKDIEFLWFHHARNHS